MTAVITLTTDFGPRDSYVAEMKAVILGLNPAVRLIDVSHEVAAHDVIEGALALHAMVAVCPEGTIHVAVVDPRVGTHRRGLVVAAVWDSCSSARTTASSRRSCRILSVRRLSCKRRNTVDRGSARRCTAATSSLPRRLTWLAALRRQASVHRMVERLARRADVLTVRIAGRRMPVVRTYGDLPIGGAGALAGSHGRLEVAVREGSAAARFRVRRGTTVRLSRSTISRTRARTRW